ncbi:cytochrome P450 2U1-like [Lytechinus pictus]|uniref:cytochrome P450 2U1-like n=1 Tax=Lytechinus pictus TaxID=7653 RepID=UPI0030B9AFC9
MHNLFSIYCTLSTETVVIFVISSVIASFLIAKCTSGKRIRRPPGPWAWPVVGNLPSILLGGQPHQALARFAEKYGQIMSISLGPGPNVVVLTSLAVVKELLVKHADCTSDRRIPPLLGLAFSTKGSVIWENGDKWKCSRRTALSAFRRSTSTSSNFGATVRSSLQHLRSSLQRLDGHRCNPRSEITTAIAEIISSICFGHCVDVRSNPEVIEVIRAQHNLSSGLSGISLGHIFPRLYHTPLYNKLRQDIDQYKRFMKEVVKDHKRNQVSNDGENGDGIRKNSFEDVTDRYLQQMQHGSIVAVEEEDIWRVMFDLMGAGTETTSETLLWGILYLSLYPDVQKQIHSEIDEMTLKDSDDVIHYDQRKSLPYTQAAILEVLRCACVAPLSLPRVTTRDLTVMGYSIPKGVEIWVNEWAINRDKNIWSDSNEFNPGRFLDDSGRIDPKRKESIIAFGEGRRMCLGRCLAEHMLFMFFTNLLRRFSFRLPEDGRTRPNVNRGNFGLTYSPPLFDVIITPRDID